jgi:hypothetical protein
VSQEDVKASPHSDVDDANLTLGKEGQVRAARTARSAIEADASAVQELNRDKMPQSSLWNRRRLGRFVELQNFLS